MARTSVRVFRQSCAAAVDACVADGRRPRAVAAPWFGCADAKAWMRADRYVMVFNKTGTNTVAGDYYLTDVDWDGTCSTILNPGDPYPISGVRRAGVGSGIEADPAAETTAPGVRRLASVLGQLR